MEFAKNLIRQMLWKESVLGPFVLAGLGALAARVTILRSFGDPELANQLTLAILGIGGAAGARQTASSKATTAKVGLDAATLTVEKVTPDEITRKHEVPPPAQLKVEEAVKEALVKAGVVAGKEAVGKAGKLIGRFNPFG